MRGDMKCVKARGSMKCEMWDEREEEMRDEAKLWDERNFEKRVGGFYHPSPSHGVSGLARGA